jgi:cell division FtsZ-interacting protein ZapD
MDSAVARAVASAPSPRVAAFLRRGGRHASEVAAAPERFCDAAQGVASAAKTCQESLARADEAYDAFVKSLSGGGGVCEIDAVPTGALLAALPLGDDRRTAEQWLWLLTAVLEALARETEVVREVAAYVSRDAPAESRVEDPPEEDPLDAETLAGCAEVWRARAFVDEALLQVLAGAEA